MKQRDLHEYPVHGITWTAGIGRPAGIFWLSGRSVIAAHGSSAEGYLLDRGAILIATLLFDGDPLERPWLDRAVDRIAAREYLEFTNP